MHPATCTTVGTARRRRLWLPGPGPYAVDPVDPAALPDDLTGEGTAGDGPDWRLGVEVDAAFPAGFEDLAEVRHGVYRGDAHLSRESGSADWELILHDIVCPF